MACTIKFKDGTEMSEAEFYAWAMDNIDLKEFAKTGNAIFINKKEQAAQFSAIKKLAYNLQKGFQALFGSKVEIITDTEEIDRILAGDQKGIKKEQEAWHGTPHKVGKFSTEFIGTGEGAQAFGWGLYFTDLESIARGYANKLTKKGLLIVNDEAYNYLLDLIPSSAFASTPNELLEIITENLQKENGLDNLLDKYRITSFNDTIQGNEYFLNRLKEGASLYSKETLDFVLNLTNSDKSNSQKTKEFNEFFDRHKKAFKDAVNKLKENPLSIVNARPRYLYKATLHKGKTPDQYTWLEWDKPIDKQIADKLEGVIQFLYPRTEAVQEFENSIFENLFQENAIPVFSVVSRNELYDYFKKLGLDDTKALEASERILNKTKDEYFLYNLQNFEDSSGNKKELEKYRDIGIEKSRVKKELPPMKKNLYEDLKKEAIGIAKKTLPEELKEYKTGEEIYREIESLNALDEGWRIDENVSQKTRSNWAKQASLFLLENGIDGIKYPAESIATGATSDTARGFNYVVFDENAITIEEEIQFMRDPKGKVLGFVYEGKIYIDPRTASPTTPIHEFGHIWNQYMKENHKSFYNRGIKLIKEEGGAYIEKVKKLYPELAEKGREADLYEEALAQAIGDKGALLAKQDQPSFLNWLKDMWKFVKDGLKLSVSAEALSNMTLNDYTNLVAGSMLKGAEIATLLKAERTSQASTNPKFIKEVVKNLYAKKEKITTTIKNLMSELYKAESKGYANAMKSMKEREAAVIKLKEAAFKFLEDRGIKASDAMKLAISKITDAKSFARTLVKLSDMDESGIRAKKIGDIKKLVKQIKSLKKRNNKLTSADIYYIDNIAFPSPYEVSDLDGYEKVLTELKDSLDKGIRNVGVITKEKFNAFIQQESDYINAYKEMMFDIKQMIKDLETEAEYNELEANGLLAGTNIKSLEAWEKLKESINDIEESDAAQAKLDAIQERIEAKSEALDGLKERTKELMKLNKEEIVEAFKEFDGTPTPLSYEEIFNNIDNLSYNQLVKLGNIIDNILSDNDFSGIGAIASLGRLNAKSDNLFKELGNRVLRSFKDLKTENLSIQQLISEIAYAGDSINKALDFILGDWNSMISRVKKSYEQTFSNYEDLKRALANKKDKNKPLAIFNSTVRIDTYAFVNQWFKSDTEAEQNSHIVDRAKALADQHIRTLKAYGKVPNPSLSAKIEIDKAKKGLEALQDFGLIEDLDINNLSYSLNTKATKDSLLGKLNDKELKLYNFVIDSFKNLVNFKNALKINLDTQYEDIENYFPTFPKKIQEDADEASTEELKSVFNRMSKSNSRAKGRSRNLSSGKYNYNTGLTENFSKGYWEALILDMGSSELLDMSNMLYSKAGLQKLSEAGLNAEDTIPILRQRLNEKAVSDVNQGNINTNVSNAISIEMERTIKNGVVGMILKSPKQVLKQGNALLTSLIFKPQAASLAISMLHNPDKYYLAIQNILDKSTIQSRLILYDLNPVDLGVPSEYMYGKGRRTFAGLKKTQSAQETIGDVALPILKKMGAYKGNYSSFLASTDAHISKVNILTGYIDHQMKNGKTFEQIIKDLNDNKINSVSLQSAERWQSDLNAESIRSNIAPMLRKNVSGGKYFMKTFPFTTHQS